MNARRAASSLALTAVLVAGCGTATPASRGPAAEAPSAGSPFLATSMVTPTGTWAVALMGGGSVSSHNNFWQLFVRPAGSARWNLATPPGAADNGGLVAAISPSALITAIRPSQYLTYTPLSVTRDDGQAWSQAGPLNAALADTPDGLAAAPGTGDLLALLASGTAELATPSYTRWIMLASERDLAATSAGRRCGPDNFTAATFSPAGVPLLATTCGRPGTAGIFASKNRTWQAAGPHLPASLGRQTITVVRLTRAANQTVALLQAGTGHAAILLAAWSADSGAHWALSAPLPLHQAKLLCASFGAASAVMVMLSGNQAQAITGPGTAWRSLPALPSGIATLAPGPSGGFDALAVHGAMLTVWRLDPGAATWRTIQVMKVPIQYGSSG